MSYDTSSNVIPFTIKGKYKPFKKGLTLEFLKPIQIGEDLTLENERLMKIISNELTKG
jgi:hypothetical protein